jgi:alkylated DNA repair protein alkB family protein 6
MEKHLIEAAPPSMFYIPDFISAEEEASLLNKVRNKQDMRA